MSDAARRARLLRVGQGVGGPVEPTAADWSSWVQLATAERVLPQLHAVALQAVGLTDEQRAQARAFQLDVAATMVRLERSLLQVADVLDGAGTPFAVLKGGATAHLDHADPAERQFGDIDLLVSPADLPRARTALEGAGWAQAYRLPRHHEELTHSVTFSRGGLTELDLHQRIAHRALGRVVPPEELLAAREPFTLAGRSLWALSRPDRLLHAAVHALASRGEYRRLSSRLDVLVLAARSEAEAPSTVSRARRWGLDGLLDAAVRGAFAEAELPLPPSWGEALAPVRGRRRSMLERAYLSERRRPALEELAHLRHMPGWRRRARYLRGYFLIDRALDQPGSRVPFVERARYLRSRLRNRDR